MSVIDQLRQYAAERPQKPAVIAADATLSFAELDERTSRMAHVLHASGIRPGDKVALVLGNDEAAQFATVYLGAMKLGAVPTPLNVRWARPEKLFVLSHSDAVAVVVGRDHLPMFQDLPTMPQLEIAGQSTQLALRHFWVTGEQSQAGFQPLQAALDQAGTNYPAFEPTPEDPADLLYTSGTTGMPKGVLVPQGNLIGSEQSAELLKAFGALYGENLLHALPVFGFAGCHGAFLMALRLGLTHIPLPRFDPEGFLRAIQDHRATSIDVVPTMLNLMLNHPNVGQYDYSSLQFVFFGAAPIQVDTIKKMVEVWPGVMMLNAYGLTEGGTNAVLFLGPDPQEVLKRPTSVGRSLDGSVVIMDPDGNPLPQGQVGEICFRGTASTRRRYYKGEAQTNEMWRGGVLHTGDAGTMDEEGYVYITDRIKDMIIRGGYNIYANEVEGVLLTHPDVLEVAVVGIPHAMLGEDLLAVIVPQPGRRGGEGALAPAALHEYCKQYLADYKCPRHVVFAEELPKNAMQKVVKRDLRERYKSLLAEARQT